MKVNVTAIVKSKAGKSEILEIILQKLVIGSRKEKACLQYDLHQSTEDETVFIFHETWADDEGLEIHTDQPYFKQLGQKLEGILAIPIIIHFTKLIS